MASGWMSSRPSLAFLPAAGEWAVSMSLCISFARSSDFISAIACIDKAIELYPKEANYYDSKGEILLMQGKEKEAVEMWEKVILLDPDFVETYNSELHHLLVKKKLISEYEVP